eukprot:PLAT1764.2.p1 GENE.PLAT1764.2~~PLAT1764.2.p1  ORF type:complete len:333 (-),score=151.61 PLAT1764.2:76-1074(-)
MLLAVIALLSLALLAAVGWALRERAARKIIDEQRAEERIGRIGMEKRLRDAVLAKADEDGHAMKAIGHISSCFDERRGTPRQGMLCPSARGQLQLAHDVPKYTLEGLETYSHVWLLFVFHENTNVHKSAKKKGQRFPGLRSKIVPPRLGRKTGLLSTRSPHRPNPLGLSAARLLSVEGHTLHLAGLDLLTGTPVLDVKPYVPVYDSIPDAIFPAWVEPAKPIPVELDDEPAAVLQQLVTSGSLLYYDSVDAAMEAIQDVLGSDIRAVHHGRGGDTSVPYMCRLDRMLLRFHHRDGVVRVFELSLRDAEAEAAEEKRLAEEGKKRDGGARRRK